MNRKIIIGVVIAVMLILFGSVDELWETEQNSFEVGDGTHMDDIFYEPVGFAVTPSAI
ncbi:MAG: hypothetical protein IJW18_02230 [Lachnospiraceae bacterium]|nr:hypothetical protein [Lachnospiraceae bacterium]